jgi:hypothetical protein
MLIDGASSARIGEGLARENETPDLMRWNNRSQRKAVPLCDPRPALSVIMHDAGPMLSLLKFVQTLPFL